MLVVDRVELQLVHQLHQVRKLERQHTSFGKHRRKTTGKVVDVWHVSEHVVCDQQVRWPVALNQFGG